MNVYAELYPKVDELLARPLAADEPERRPVGERLIFQYLGECGLPLASFEPPVLRMRDFRLPRRPVWVPATS